MRSRPRQSQANDTDGNTAPPSLVLKMSLSRSFLPSTFQSTLRRTVTRPTPFLRNMATATQMDTMVSFIPVASTSRRSLADIFT
mgnify:CR=1 FL=1